MSHSIYEILLNLNEGLVPPGGDIVANLLNRMNSLKYKHHYLIIKLFLIICGLKKLCGRVRLSCLVRT